MANGFDVSTLHYNPTRAQILAAADGKGVTPEEKALIEKARADAWWGARARGVDPLGAYAEGQEAACARAELILSAKLTDAEREGGAKVGLF